MKKALLFIHGKNGCAEESEHYRALFPDCDIIGFDYQSETPWEARDEFTAFFDSLREVYPRIMLAANSIGAYFAMNALYDRPVERAYFISPVVDMEKLIADMLQWTGATERELRDKGTIGTGFGETLSWNYLSWVRSHPLSWPIPTRILYGGKDQLQSFQTVAAFAGRIGAELTVMEDGEHWFHTDEQMAFLDNWIRV